MIRTLTNSRLAFYTVVWLILADTMMAVYFHVAMQGSAHVDGRAGR